MIDLLISPVGFCIMTNNDGILDVSERMKDELDLYTSFCTFLDMDELISEKYNHASEEIYELIVRKIYLDNDPKNTGFKGKGDLKDGIKFKLLCAFNKVFIDVCENKLGNRIRIDYI